MRPKGFTLIELLIVVAIIGILAAIAIPNFLEAQVRAKVARGRADMHSCNTALEAYYVDHNEYPIDGSWSPDYSPFWYLPNHITHPIAYLSSLELIDPFRSALDAAASRASDSPDGDLYQDADYTRYRYRNFKYTYDMERALAPVYVDPMEDYYGKWAMNSSGPDRTYGPTRTVSRLGVSFGASIPYDSSNGTVSSGDIVRCPKYPGGNLPYP